MKIEFKKINVSEHELKITRADKTTERTVLHTKTYMLHDICHYYVEKALNTLDGFWGMLSQGYQLEQLAGKHNPLTKKLKIIECIVGGTQSVYAGNMDESGFWNYMQTVDYTLPDDQFLKNVIPQIREFMNQWNYLPVGQSIALTF